MENQVPFASNWAEEESKFLLITLSDEFKSSKMVTTRSSYPRQHSSALFIS